MVTISEPNLTYDPMGEMNKSRSTSTMYIGKIMYPFVIHAWSLNINFCILSMNLNLWIPIHGLNTSFMSS